MNDCNKVDTRSNIRTITSNSFITSKGLESLSLKARKMLYIAISQCRKDDKEFYEYEISVKDFAKLMGVTPEAVYSEADKITDELLTGMLKVMPVGKRYFKKYSLFSMCEYEHDGVLRFKLNPDMTEFLLNLRGNFTQPLLEDFLKMKSPYSMAVWHLMQREMRSKKPNSTSVLEFDLMLTELRQVTGTQAKLKQLCQFKEKCFDKAIREIDDNCGVSVTYSNIKKGRTVVGFHCKAVSWYHIDENKISQKTKDKVEMSLLRIESTRRRLTQAEEQRYNELMVELTFKRPRA